jgi:hypothetical protein
MMTPFERALLIFGPPIIVIFAAALVWVVGHRGIFIYDHGIILDGGYRVYMGQVPYRDIYMAYLPGALWIQALFLWLWGVNFSAMIVPACLFNAIAAAIVMRICWRLFPGRVAACLAGGLLTAVWFQAPYGGLLHEDCAFTFAALSLWLVFETEGTGPRSTLLQCIAGILTWCAVLCKQNAGGFFVPILFFVLFLRRVPEWKEVFRSWLAAVSGIAAGAAGFAFWLWRYSDFQRMRLFALEIPSQVGRERIFHHVSLLIRKMIGAATPELFPLFNAVWVTLAIVVALFAAFGSFADNIRRRALSTAGFLSLALFLYQQFFQVTSLNEAQNGVPFIGLMFALVLAALQELFDGKIDCRVFGPVQARLSISQPAVNRCLAAYAVFFSLLLFIDGFVDDFQRIVHFDRGTRFIERIDVRAASSALWAEPNVINHTVVKKSEFEAVVHFLEQHTGNFFTFPDATILYSFVGRVPPQPLLYFTEGHSYRQQDISWLDPEILAALKKNRIRYFIQEKDAFLGNAGTLPSFPLVWNWLHTSFSPVANFGFFEVWERRQ